MIKRRVINKTYECVAWRWANAKINKENVSLFKQTIHISKGNMEDYNLAIFTNAMDFFEEHMSLKKSIPEHFFTSLLNDLSTEDLVTFGNLLLIKCMKPKKWMYATSCKQAWVPQKLKNKVLNHLMNHQMIGLALKPQEVYDSRKRQCVEK
jgi:hypothetical protein